MPAALTNHCSPPLWPDDLNEVQRVLLCQEATPSVMVLDGRTMQSTPETGTGRGRGQAAQGH